MTCSTKLKEFLKSLDWETKDNVSETKIGLEIFQIKKLEFPQDFRVNSKSNCDDFIYEINCDDFVYEIKLNPTRKEVAPLGGNNDDYLIFRYKK